MPDVVNGRIRIHQALRNAKWDINNILAPTDLGVLAFNNGVTWARTGDYNNGLGLMINGIQYAYCVATKYLYDSAAAKCSIALRFVFYDVCCLDDDDLKEYGVTSDAYIQSAAAKGITAWWRTPHPTTRPEAISCSPASSRSKPYRSACSRLLRGLVRLLRPQRLRSPIVCSK